MTVDQAVSHLLSNRYGLRPREAWNQLIRHTVVEHGYPDSSSPTEIHQWLLARPALLAALLGRLVVSESYFFRHEDQLAVLAEDLVTRLASGPREPCVVWSAGCARGEEIYSLGLTLANALGPGAAARVRLCATDVSTAAVAQAKSGQFDAWSWRREPRLHEHVSFHDDGRFTVSRWLRDWVEFDVALVRERADTLPCGHVDAILFRNVAIYLTAEALAATYRAMHRVLRPGGLLLVAPTDPPPSDFIDVERSGSPTPVFRKPDRANQAFGGEAVTEAHPRPTPDAPPAELDPTRALRRAMGRLAEDDYNGATAVLCRATLLFPDHQLLRYWSAYALLRGGYVRRAGIQLNALFNQLSARDERQLLEDAETTTGELLSAVKRLQQEIA